jgi:hypothetical protein
MPYSRARLSPLPQPASSDAKLDALEGRVVAALTAKLRAAIGLVPTYPGEIDVPDNAVMFATLALAARGPGHGRARLRRGRQRCPSRRGESSGAAWSAMYLAYVDEAFAREQARALALHFEERALGLFAGVCEYPGCGVPPTWGALTR